MQKIVINIGLGGFGLSDKAFKYININGDIKSKYEVERTNNRLIEFIENNSISVASSRYAKLKIVEIPDDVEWVIQEQDGIEWVAEKHRIWD